jgi:hypothetical protein
MIAVVAAQPVVAADRHRRGFAPRLLPLNHDGRLRNASFQHVIEIIQKHRGVTLGRAKAAPGSVFGLDSPGLDVGSSGEIDLAFLSFDPRLGYFAIQPVLARAWQAFSISDSLAPLRIHRPKLQAGAP